MADGSKYVFIALLLVVAAWGVWGVHVFGGQNDFFDRVNALREATNAKLPGTKDPLLRIYTGLKPLDEFLTILTIVFQGAVDGSSPSACLFTLEFYGQVASLTTILLIEGLRRGNKGRIVSFVGIMGMIYQSISVALTIPVYWAFSLLTSPAGFDTTAAELTLRRRELYAIPFAIVLGFTVPSIFMALPASVVGGNETHQRLIAVWQAFPIYVSVIHLGLTKALDMLLPPARATKPHHENRSLLKTLRVIHAIAVFDSASAHIASISIAKSVEWFPTLFQPGVTSSVSLSSVFLPPALWSEYFVSSLADGFHALIQYDMYAMCLGTVVWTVAIHRDAHIKHGDWNGWTVLLLKTVIASIFLGPIAAAVILVWERDELVLGSRLFLEEKKTL